MERERITISIKRDVLKGIDKTIDGISIRNRSHAIETMASNTLVGNANRNVVILIGGKGALKLIPPVEEILGRLSDAGYEKVYIAVGFLADKIKNVLGNGDRFGLELEYLEKGEGTAGAILPLKNVFKDTFLVINPEKIIKAEFAKLISFHKTHNCLATIVTDDLKDLTGLYALEPEIFNYIPKGFSMLENDIFFKLHEQNELVVYPTL